MPNVNQYQINFVSFCNLSDYNYSYYELLNNIVAQDKDSDSVLFAELNFLTMDSSPSFSTTSLAHIPVGSELL